MEITSWKLERKRWKEGCVHVVVCRWAIYLGKRRKIDARYNLLGRGLTQVKLSKPFSCMDPLNLISFSELK
jgi:hypothetical protein